MKKDLEEASYWLKVTNNIAIIFLAIAVFSISYILLMTNAQLAFFYKMWAAFSFTVIGISMMLFISVSIGKSLERIEKIGYKPEKIDYMFVVLIIWIVVMFLMTISIR